MANFLRGLGQLAGVAGQTIQGYGMDRENAVRQAMLKAREQREAEQLALAQKVAEQQMATGRLTSLLQAQQAGYRKPQQVGAAMQKAAAPTGLTVGGVALPENLPAVAKIAAGRGNVVDVPGAGQLELDATQTPDALAEARDFREYGRRSTDDRNRRSLDRQDRAAEREDEQQFIAGQNALDRQNRRDITGDSSRGKTVTLGSGNAMQSNSIAFARRMMAADLQMRENEETGKPGVLVEATQSVIPVAGKPLARAMSSDEQQKYEQAKKEYISAQMRKESGAQINAGEWEQAAERYARQLFQKSGSLEQKREARRLATEMMMRAAGPAATPEDWGAFEAYNAKVSGTPSGGGTTVAPSNRRASDPSPLTDEQVLEAMNAGHKTAAAIKAYWANK